MTGVAAGPDGEASMDGTDERRGAAVGADVVLRARRAVVGGRETSASVHLSGERIVAVEAYDAPVPEGARVVDLADDEVLLPGLVDSHVHVNEPGRTEWEGFASATRAAAAGGVTTIIDMPLNSIPPTVNVAALEEKRAVARDQAYVDVGFWGGAIPGNVPDLRPLHDAGVFGFKCFLLHSGVDEFPHLEPDELEAAMRETGSLDALMIVHAEDSHAIDHAVAPDGEEYDRFLHSRPRGAENLAIAQVIELARWTGARAHILHLSSSDALPMIRSARADGVRLTVETCPHYLSFTAEEIPDGATEFKCCPPIREAANRELLWDGLVDGDDRHRRHRPLAVHRGPQAVRHRRLRPGVGRHRRSPGRPVGHLDRCARAGPVARRRRPVDGDRSRRPDRAHRPRSHRASARWRTSPSSPPTRSSPSRSATCTTRTPCRRTPAARLTGVVRQTWLHGTPVDLGADPRGRLLTRGQS